MVVTPMVVILGQQYNVGKKPTVILYTYINHHAQLPVITQHTDCNVVHSYEDSTIMSITVLSNHTRIPGRGLGNQKKCRGILYNIINCHARVSHKHRIQGKPGLQLLCLQKNQNVRRPCYITSSMIGWVSLKGILV